MLKKIVKHQGIFQKLLLTHVLLAITIIAAFYIMVSLLYKPYMYERNAENFQEINRQIGINVDGYFQRFINLSETPYYTSEVRYAMENGEEEDKVPGSLYEATRDMAIRMFLAEQRLHSLYITFDKMSISYSRGYNGSSNVSYDISQETWYDELYALEGKVKVLPLHPLCCEEPDSELVLSVGRCIVKPLTKEPLGLMLLNIKPSTLRSVLEEPLKIEGAATYVVDENDKIAYSTLEEESLSSLGELGLDLNPSLERQTLTFRGETVLAVSSVAENTGLRVISIVSLRELNRQIDAIVRFCTMAGIFLLLFAAAVAYGSSRTISDPIRKLAKEMVQFESDGENVKRPRKSADEIEYLRAAFQDMVERIESLIRRVVEEGEQKRKAEVLALQSQINPHFMYNSLNTIKLMAEIQGDTGIAKAIQTFSELLHDCCRSPDSEVTVENELRFAERYMDLMRLRYFNRFSYRVIVDEETKNYRMLKFILQPFLENAIFHGFSNDDRSDYCITLRGWTDGQVLHFRVEDNGEGFSNAALLSDINTKKVESMTSIGIANVISRIELHYGRQYGVHIESREDGTEIHIRLPLIKEGENHV